jgi:hypothetical protein
MSDEEVIYPPIKTGKEVFNYVNLYDIAEDQLVMHSTVIYGESGDGKSYITNTLLDALSPYINILHIFCPTAKIDTKFPMWKYTSPAFVHETLDMQCIRNIMKRCAQEREMLNTIMIPSVMSNSVKGFILPLYKTNGKDELYDRALVAFRRIKKIERRFDRDDATLDEREEHDTMLVGMYKTLMYQCKRYLRETRTSIPSEYKELSLPVLFYDLKPCDIIMTNDFGDCLDSLKKDDAITASNLVTKERHFGITTIHLVQDLTHIKKSDRRQIKVNIFLSPGSITSYISTLGVKGRLKSQLEAASEHVLSADKYQSKRKFPAVIYLKQSNIVGYTYADSKLELNQKGNVRLYKKLEPLLAKQMINNPLMDIFAK